MLTGLGIDPTLRDETPEGSGVRLATMCRVKGLEQGYRTILVGMACRTCSK
jgi:hypothetical protein